jgi:hypothetical protein
MKATRKFFQIVDRESLSMCLGQKSAFLDRHKNLLEASVAPTGSRRTALPKNMTPASGATISGILEPRAKEPGRSSSTAKELVAFQRERSKAQ